MDDKILDDEILGPFKNAEEISEFWYQVTEAEIERSIKYTKKELEDYENTDDTTAILKKDLKYYNQELSNLRQFVDDHARCIERYKFDKKILQQIKLDWHDYNDSLFADSAQIKSMWYNPPSLDDEEEIKHIQRQYRQERIRKEEIEKRIRDLLR